MLVQSAPRGALCQCASQPRSPRALSRSLARARGAARGRCVWAPVRCGTVWGALCVCVGACVCVETKLKL